MDASASKRDYAYKAFMSYSHAADGTLAPKLQQALHKFAKPLFARRSLRVFRDETTLAVTPHLWPDIARGLDGSEYFILLASPEAARSQWVAKEVRHWLKRNSPETILIVLTGGKIKWNNRAADFDWDVTDAVPRTLQNVFRDEPKWEDVSQFRLSKDLKTLKPILDHVTASLYSKMTGRPLDEVIGEDVANQRRIKTITTVTAVTLLALAVTGFQFYTKAQTEIKDRLRYQSNTLAALSVQQNKTYRYAAGVLSGIEASPDPARCDRREEITEALWALRGSNINHAMNLQPRNAIAHLGAITSAALSRDGKWYASGSSNGVIRIFDTSDWKERKTLEGHFESVLNLEFSADGKYLLSSAGDNRPRVKSQDNDVRIWDLETSQLRIPPLKGAGHVYQARFDRSSSRVVSVSEKAAFVWDAVNGQQLFALSAPEGHTATVYGAIFSPDETLIATISKDGRIGLWDAASGISKGFLSDPDIVQAGAWYRTLAFVDGGKRLVAGARNGILSTFDVASGTLVSSSKVHKAGTPSGIMGLAVSPNGKWLASAGTDGTAKIYDAASGKTLQILSGHDNQVKGIAFNADSSKVLTWSRDGTARVWVVETGAQMSALRGHSNEVGVAGFLSDDPGSGGRGGVVTGSDDKMLRVWTTAPLANAVTLRPRWLDEPNVGLRGIGALRVSPDGKRIVAGSNGGRLAVFNAQTGEQQLSLPGHGAPVLDVRFSPDGQTIATVSGHLDDPEAADRSIRIWDAATGSELKRIDHAWRLRSVEFSPDGKKLLAAATDKAVIVATDASSQEKGLIGAVHGGPITSATWSPDGKMIATSSMDATVRLWDSATLQELDSSKPIRLGAGVYRVNWFRYRDETLILAASGDSRLTLWDPATRKRRLDIDDQVDGDGDWFQWADALRGQGLDGGNAIIALTGKNALRVWGIAPDPLAEGRIEHKELASIKPYGTDIYSVASDASGQKLILGLASGIAVAADLGNYAQALQTARTAVACCLTQEQKEAYGIGAESRGCQQRKFAWWRRLMNFAWH